MSARRRLASTPSVARKPAVVAPRTPPTKGLLALQPTAGNMAVARGLLEAEAEAAARGPRPAPDTTGVRLRTDRAAGLAALRRHAEAFTVGSDIHFAPGAFRPGTDRGDRLLAHELTHVAQQAEGRAPRAPQDQRQPTADRNARIAELERRLADPNLSAAEVLRLNQERNALLAPPSDAGAPPPAASGGAAPPPAVPHQLAVNVSYEATPADPGGADTVLPAIAGGAGTTGVSILGLVDPLPGNPALGDPNVFTRFAGGTSTPWNLNPELRPRLFQGGDLARFAPYEQAGIRFADLSRLARALRAGGGAASLSAEDAALLRTVARIHAVEGGVGASPLLSLTELVPEEALQRLPPVATGRTYIVRVRIDPADVVRVNQALGQEGRTAALVTELEVLVGRDLGGRGTRILSINANPSPSAPLGGWRAPALRWGGRALVVVGAALTIGEVLTASGPNRRETQGRAFGAFAGGTLLGAFGVGFCVGAGIATGGVALLLCGLAFGAAGGFAGGAIGGRVGAAFD